MSMFSGNGLFKTIGWGLLGSAAINVYNIVQNVATNMPEPSPEEKLEDIKTAARTGDWQLFKLLVADAVPDWTQKDIENLWNEIRG